MVSPTELQVVNFYQHSCIMIYCSLQVDKYFVGELPPKQITFTNLNDNVREQFLRSMCERYGDLESIRIYHHPKTKKHLGLASVTYTKTRYAKEAAMGLNRTSVMGRIIIVQVDAGGKCVLFILPFNIGNIGSF